MAIANYLCPGNYAVSGGVEGCDAVEKLAKEYKARCMRLAVAGAFHTRYMQPAEEKLRSAALPPYSWWQTLTQIELVSPKAGRSFERFSPGQH